MKNLIILFALLISFVAGASAQFGQSVEYVNSFPANTITGYSPAGNITRGYGIIGSPLSDALNGYKIKQVSFYGPKKTDSVSIWGGWIDSATAAGVRDTIWEQLWLKPVRKLNSAINTSAGSNMFRDTTMQWVSDVGKDRGTNWGTYEFNDYNFQFYQFRRGIIDTGKVFYRIKALGY